MYDPAAGKALFNANCAACHKLDAKMTGRASCVEPMTDIPKEWLVKWIHGSAALIASGDADAVKLFGENNKIPMPAFPQLSTGDIDNIIAYTSEPKEEAKPAAGVAGVPGAASAEGWVFLTILYLVL